MCQVQQRYPQSDTQTGVQAWPFSGQWPTTVIRFVLGVYKPFRVIRHIISKAPCSKSVAHEITCQKQATKAGLEISASAEQAGPMKAYFYGVVDFSSWGRWAGGLAE